MARYHVESRHTKRDCMSDFDELAEHPMLLRKFEWACPNGLHMGWAMLEADSEDEVRRMLPAGLREKARITEVCRVTPSEVKSWHEM